MSAFLMGYGILGSLTAFQLTSYVYYSAHELNFILVHPWVAHKSQSNHQLYLLYPTAYRMTIYAGSNLANWLRIVKFMSQNISKFWFLKIIYVSYHWQSLWKSN